MSIINTFSDPSIVLDEMALKLSVIDDNPAEVKAEHIVGHYYPIIQINTFILGPNNLQSFKLSSEGFVPEVQFTFSDMNQEFKSLFYPKDGDLVSVYIKSHQDDVFKPIRIDFDIMSFTDLGGFEFSVRGVMNIPLISTEICKAYPELSSFELLQKLADELKLGYASNEDETSDLMTWINAYNTYERFIQDSTMHVYKDERSFYTSYIDMYYYLNLINVNKQFEEFEPEKGIVSPIIPPQAQEVTKDANEDTSPNEVDLFLTSHPNYLNTNFGIEDYRIINESGSIWKNHGYKRFARFFDLNDNEYYSFFVDPVTTEGAENDSLLMKGRAGDMIYEDINRFKYLGIQLAPPPGDDEEERENTENEEDDSEESEEDEEGNPRPEQSNVHRNYYYSKVQNIQNNEELKKITIKATTATVNSQIYRYQTIPILFYENGAQIINTLRTRDQEVDNASDENDNEKEDFNQLKLNTLISGLYVVSGISYVWDDVSTSVKQELTLTRREWPIHLPKEFESKNNRK